MNELIDYTGVLADYQIDQLARDKEMISPFCSEQVVKNNSGEKVISYGNSSYGYDARISNHFKIFSNTRGGIVDPKHFDGDCYVDIQKEELIIPPNSFILGSTVEYFKIPSDIIVICLGKSTYARAGLFVNVTPLEPGFEGNITIEIANATPCPAKVYANEGICQFIFFKGNPCVLDYAGRNGKYQNQTGITTPRMK